MSRRELLAFLAAAGCLGGGCAKRPVTPNEPGARRGPSPDGPPIARALALGLHAPSPHNTQSWRFEIRRDDEVLLFVDRDRLLPATDPPARQIHIGCGCFVEAFALGAPRLGLNPAVELFPEGVYTELDAGQPVARLRVRAGAGAPDPLAEWIESRATSRLRYEGPMLTAAALRAVERDARLQSSTLGLRTDSQMEPLLDLLDRAMTTEFLHRDANEETRHWFRFTPAEAARERDGLTFETNGLTGSRARLARRFTEDTEASWNHRRTIRKGLEAFRKGLYSSRGLVWLSTASNTHRDHVEVGRDCYRLMLALTASGLASHPVNQVLQEYESMDTLRAEFERRTGVSAPAKVQMILRVGRSAPPEVSYRRALSSFV